MSERCSNAVHDSREPDEGNGLAGSARGESALPDKDVEATESDGGLGEDGGGDGDVAEVLTETTHPGGDGRLGELALDEDGDDEEADAEGGGEDGDEELVDGLTAALFPSNHYFLISSI